MLEKNNFQSANENVIKIRETIFVYFDFPTTIGTVIKQSEQLRNFKEFDYKKYLEIGVKEIKEHIKEIPKKFSSIEDFLPSLIQIKAILSDYQESAKAASLDFSQFVYDDKPLNQFLTLYLEFLEHIKLSLEKWVKIEFETETKTVGHRGKKYKTLTIGQKIILIHYLTEYNLFPRHDLKSQSFDKYIVALGMLFNDDVTNLDKKFRTFEKELRAFKKPDEKRTFKEYSPILFKDVNEVKKWLTSIDQNILVEFIDKDLSIDKDMD